MRQGKQGRVTIITNVMLCGFLVVLLFANYACAQQVETLRLGDTSSAPESIQRAEIDLRGNYYFISEGAGALWKWSRESSRNIIQADGIETSDGSYSPVYADLEVTNGLKIYAADIENNRVHVFERHMEWIGTIDPVSGNNQTSLNPDLIAVDDQNRLYVYDGDRQILRRYDEYGTPDRAFTLPMDITERIVDMEMTTFGLIAIDRRRNLHQISVLGRYERSVPLRNILTIESPNIAPVRLHATGPYLFLVYGDQLFHIEDRMRIAHQWTLQAVSNVAFADGWAGWEANNRIHRTSLSGINDLKSLLLTDNK